MKQFTEEELLLKKSLLGELSREEQADIEERLFSDAEFFRQFRAAEDELIDEYVYGDLSADERERFEREFLITPERRQSLKVARVLRKYVLNETSAATAAPDDEDEAAPLPAKKSLLDFLRTGGRTMRLSLAAAAILIAAVGVGVITRTALRSVPPPSSRAKQEDRQPTPPERARADAGQPVGRQDSGQDATPSPSPPAAPPQEVARGDVNDDGSGKPSRPPRRRPARVLTFHVLPVGNVRDAGGGNELKLPADVDAVLLTVPLIEAEGFRRYRMNLQTEEGALIKSWTGLRPVKGETGQVVSGSIPSKTLGRRNYRLALEGTTDGRTFRLINIYHLRITR